MYVMYNNIVSTGVWSSHLIRFLLSHILHCKRFFGISFLHLDDFPPSPFNGRTDTYKEGDISLLRSF